MGKLRRIPIGIFKILVLSILLFSTLFSQGGASLADTKKKTASKDYEKVIVELKDLPTSAFVSKMNANISSSQQISKIQSHKKNLQKSHQDILQKAKIKGISVKKSHEYTYSFNGFAVTVEKDDLKILKALPGVKKVYPDAPFHASLDKSVPLINAPEVWKMKDDDGQIVTGKGSVVAIIDTGIDYTHPDLGKEFGKDHKVAGGYDFVNNDDDPMDDNGHGTHVAGIVAANGGVKGVAPDATLTAYKVLNSKGNGLLSDVIAGLEVAINPENPYPADVVNLSLSGPGDQNSPLSQAVQNAVDSGVIVAAAAGNSGPGSGTVESPGNVKDALTVGSSVSGVKVPKAEMVDPSQKDLSSTRIEFSANPSQEAITRELVDVGEGNPEDYEGLDIKGKILLIRAYPNYLKIAKFAEEKGAAGVLFYIHESRPTVSLSGAIPAPYKSTGNEKNNPTQHEFPLGSGDDGRLNHLMAMMIDETIAKELQEHLSKGDVKIKVSASDATDNVPSFSSHGPTTDFLMKPNIVAPGVEIKSTVPKAVFGSNYYRMSGTSMATPHVAGASALMTQLHKDWSAKDIISALTHSAQQLEDYDPLIQGAGRLDVKAAATTNIVVDQQAISFGLGDLENRENENKASLTFKNLGKKTATLQLSAEDAGELEGTIHFNPNTVTLAPNESKTVQVSLSWDRPKQDGEISGWVNAEVAGAGYHLSIPYHLAVRHLQVTTSPDPAVGDSEAFIYSPTELKEEPIVTIHSPDGKTNQVKATIDHSGWWRAPVATNGDGVYKLEVSAVTSKDIFISGTAFLEAISPEKDIDSPVSWRSIGPNATGGSMILPSNDKNNLKVLDPNGTGLFEWKGQKGTWEELHNLPVAGGLIVDKAVDPADNDTIYLAAKGDSDPTYQGKLFVTKNGGNDWQPINFPNLQLTGIEIDTSGNTLIALTKQNIYLSHDQGDDWHPIAGHWDQIKTAKLIGDKLYVGTSEGLYVIRNILHDPERPERIFYPKKSFKEVDYFAGDEHILLASTFADGLYGSTDGGSHWKKLFGKSALSFIHMVKYVDGTIYISADGLWVSKDLGETWTEWKRPGSAQSDLTMVDVKQPAIGKNKKTPQTLWLSALDGGIFETQNQGETYKRFGVPGATVYDLAIGRDQHGNDTLIAGTQYETYRKDVEKREKIDHATLEWGYSESEGKIGTSALFVQTSPKDPNVVYKIRKDAINSFWVYKSTDGGQKWDYLTKNTEKPYAMLIHPANPDNIFISYWRLKGSGLLISRDGGKTWKDMKLDQTVLAIAGDPNDPNHLWIGSDKGLSVSNDGGRTFKLLSDKPVNAIAVDPTDPNRLIVGGRDLYYSNDGGQTLHKAKSDNVSMYINDVLISPDHPDVMYAATGSFSEAGLIKGGRGVLKSTDGGKTWNSFTRGLKNRDVLSLEMSLDGKHLYAGTIGGSVYRIRLSVDASFLREEVKRLKSEGEITNDKAARLLDHHLTLVKHFEDQGKTDKIMKHMKGFKLLLDHQKKKELLSKKAYNVLKNEADVMIKRWEK